MKNTAENPSLITNPRRRYRGMPGWVVSGVGAALTIGGYIWTYDVVRKSETARFEAEATAIVQSLSGLLEDNLQAAQSLGGLFDASELVSRSGGPLGNWSG